MSLLAHGCALIALVAWFDPAPKMAGSNQTVGVIFGDTTQDLDIEAAAGASSPVILVAIIQPEEGLEGEPDERSAPTMPPRDASVAVHPPAKQPDDVQPLGIAEKQATVLPAQAMPDAPSLPELRDSMAGEDTLKTERVDKSPLSKPRTKQGRDKQKASKPPAGKVATPNPSSARPSATGKVTNRRDSAGGKNPGKAAKAGSAKAAEPGGNAATSNYPGKVVAKLRRSLKYPAAARAKRLRGETVVGFTISPNGHVGSVRVIHGSNSPVLDQAAIDTVRRAAPFPPIPQGSGKSVWPFTVPLAFAP